MSELPDGSAGRSVLEVWNLRTMFDTFQTLAVCPNCATQYATTVCLDCQEQRPVSEWTVGAYAGVGMASGVFRHDSGRRLGIC